MKNRARDIFEQAIEITDAGEQSQFVEEACGDDASLLRIVRSLLANHQNVDGLLETQDRDLNAAEVTRSPNQSQLQQSDQIIAGRYKLRQNIGEGGMGSVWMAEQLEPVKRKVALKMIKAGMDSKQVLARFDAERQALALMDHPNIAKVFDGGMTEQGRPYFVMEYVKGIPFTQYCDEARVPLRERLELFIPVCKAVQHAHQKGIVHRDLKPSNILICLYDGKPVPKVIDFGLAKALNQSLTEQSIFTAHGMMVGTPVYMSPEQAELNNLDIDTRTDIYSLGVILYELLTGSTPLEKAQFKLAAFNEILRLIKEVEPPRPSTRLSGSASLPNIAAQRNIEPKQLCKSLSGELDWVVMRALEKNRSRRYDTANGLANDIQRYLTGDPVLARPPTLSYRLRKFVQKNRTVVAASLLIMLSLLGGLIGTSWFAYKANKARVLADEKATEVSREKTKVELQRDLTKLQKVRAEEREQAAIEAVQRFGDVVSQNSELKNRPELKALRNELLKSPIGFFRGLREKLQNDSETSPESLDRLGQAAVNLAELTEAIGDVQDALQAYEESSKVWARLADENPTVAEYRNSLAAAYTRKANLLSSTGRLSEAMKILSEATEILEALTAEFPKVNKFRRNFAYCYFDKGRLFAKTGEPEKALVAYSRAKEMLKRLADEHPEEIEFQSDLATCHYGIAQALRGNGQKEQAIIAYNEALPIFEAISNSKPTNTSYAMGKVRCLLDIGDLLTKPGTFESAEKALDQALASLEKLVEENPSVTEFLSALAENYWSFGLLYLPTHRTEEALDAYKKSVEIRERLVSEHPTVSRFQVGLSSSYFMFGMRLQNTSPDEALAYYRKSRALKVKLIEDNPSVPGYRREFAQLENNVAVLYAQTGRAAEALASFEEVGEILEKIIEDNPTDLGSVLKLAQNRENLGIFHRSKDPSQSLSFYQRALKLRLKLLADHPKVIEHQDRLANCYVGMGETQRSLKESESAIASNRKAIEILEKLVEQNAPRSMFLRNRMASCHRVIGTIHQDNADYSKALTEYQHAAEISEKLLEKYPKAWGFFSDYGATLNNTAMTKIQLGQFNEAIELLERAIEWQQKALAKEPNSQIFRRYLDNHYLNLERAAIGLKDQQLLAETRTERVRLAIEDPRYAQMESRLSAVLAGETVKDPNELIQLAERAYATKRYETATQLYQTAFDADPKLEEDRAQQHPYNAACCAALAFLAQSERAPKEGLDESPQASSVKNNEFQILALTWLKSEFERWKTLVDADAERRKLLTKTMKHWLQDSDLVAIREAKYLADLPAADRLALEKFWTRVESLLSELKKQSD